MPPFIALLRRQRTFLILLAILSLVFFLSQSATKDRHTPTKQPIDYGRTPGQGLHESWQDDDPIEEQIDPGSEDGGVLAGWVPTFKSSKRTVLITGGAGSLAQALTPRLIDEGFSVHAVDIVARPKTLHPATIYHRGDIETTLKPLMERNTFDGIIHFAAISLELWCAPKVSECEKVNVGGTKTVVSAVEELIRTQRGKSLLSWGKGHAAPWILYASSTEVYGESSGMITEDTPLHAQSAIGKTKAAGEQVLSDAYARAQKGASSVSDAAQEELDEDDSLPPNTGNSASQLRAAIVRLSEIYGYPRLQSMSAAFLPRLVQHAVASLPIQYNSDYAPVDMLYVDDAVDGVLRVVKRLDDGAREGQRAPPTMERFNIVKSGKRWLHEEIVNVVRSESQSLSPVRDIGNHKVNIAGHGEYSNQAALDILSWSPRITLPVGLARAMTALATEAADFARDFIHHHCPKDEDFADPTAVGPAFITPEDQRNRDLWKLDNCTVNIAFNHAGFLHHVKCEDGKHCLANATKVPSYNWNQTVWIIETPPGSPKAERTTKVRFRQENGMGYLGIPQAQLDEAGEVKFEMYKPEDTEPHLDEFELSVAPDSSALRLVTSSGEWQIKPVANEAEETTSFILQRPSVDEYDMRLAVLCCPSEGDWPLVLDDHESADSRFGSTGDIPFNASRRAHLCDRAHDSHQYYTTLSGVLDKAGSDDYTTEYSKPMPLKKAPDEWELKKLRPCWNDCASPTICVQTGNCRCVQADSCPRRRENPLIALGRGPRGELPKQSHLGDLKAYDPLLANMVKKVDWRDLLLPDARAYIAAHPDLIKVHVVSGYPREKEIESAECHKLQPTHCFSADSMLYKALRHLSVPAEEAELIVLPVYQHCTGADFILHDVYHHAYQTIKGFNEPGKPSALVMTHDWGICLAFEWEIWSSRKDGKLYPDPILANTLVWSVMGDWDSNCYRPAQDVVVPARTCRSPDLVAAFPDAASVKPMRERPHLISWSGTFWGTGKNERLRLVCHRGGVADEELLPGNGPQSTFPRAWDNYMDVLRNARFCPQPKGVAGWSPRVNDALWAGCIPVLIAEATHYPFANMIDWSQISVRVHPTELDQIERILNAIPLDRIEQLQANILAIRQAFLYATDERPEDELNRRGPMFFALHEAGMRIRTQYAGKQ